MKCITCKSEGFDESVLGKDRCTFCDGTFSGNAPEQPSTCNYPECKCIVSTSTSNPVPLCPYEDRTHA